MSEGRELLTVNGWTIAIDEGREKIVACKRFLPSSAWFHSCPVSCHCGGDVWSYGGRGWFRKPRTRADALRLAITFARRVEEDRDDGDLLAVIEEYRQEQEVDRIIASL